MRQLASVLLAFAACVAQAQAPQIPTDHYGPPSCPGLHGTVRPGQAEAASQEQQQGARMDSAVLAAEPLENFGIERYRLAAYADCVGSGGCYWADLDAQYHRAEQALSVVAARQPKGEKLAMVMDIDETTLSGYCEMRQEDFGFLGSMFNAWVVSPEAAVAIPGALRLYAEAKRLGVAVFFITGRPGKPEGNPADLTTDQTPATARNLESAGFHGWAGLRLRNGPEIGMPTIAYKSSERERIAQQGYKLVLNIGDQWSDLLGTPRAEVNVKLPNPFYFLP